MVNGEKPDPTRPVFHTRKATITLTLHDRRVYLDMPQIRCFTGDEITLKTAGTMASPRCRCT